MITAEQLMKAYGGRELWNGLSFSISPGSLVAVVGHSGAGKTTLLNCIGGLDEPDAGRIAVHGILPAALRRSARRDFLRDRVAFLFQNSGLVNGWSVARNLDLALEPQSIRAADRQRMKAEAVSRVGLEHAISAPVHRLSGGERQRAALARLMLKKGDVILADEPSSALDDGNCAILCEVLLERRSANATILVSTHDPRLISICDDVLPIGAVGMAPYDVGVAPQLRATAADTGLISTG